MRMTTEMEKRTLQVEMELRSEEDGKEKIVGYALKFNRWSKTIGGDFKEMLSERSLDGTDMSDTVALINHDYNLVLGRVKANVTLSVDEIGLRFNIEPVDTTYTADLIKLLRAGIVNKCSFSFTIAPNGQEWNKDYTERTITKIEKLYDISIVTDPAYDDTEAVLSARSLQSREAYLKEIEEKILIDLDMRAYA